MSLVRIVDGSPQVYSLWQLRHDHPQVSFPEEPSAECLAEFDVYPLAATTPPEASLITRVAAADPVEVEGVWTQQWAIEPLALDEAKLALWTETKRIRDDHIDAGADAPGIGRFDTDLISRSNISGAVTMALIAQGAAQPFAMDWKLADNTIATLDASDMIAAGIAVGAHVAACHAIAQALGLAIEAAEDIAALETIDIEAGWP